MRILPVVLGLSLVGCITGEIGPTGGEGDGDGNGDGNGNGGGGGGGGDETPVPRLTVTLDKPTVATELGKSDTVTLTLTSVDGFTGAVAITPSVLNANNEPIAGLTATGPASVDVPANGTASAAFKLDIPSNISGADFAASLKLDTSSSLGAETFTSTFNVAAVYTVTYAAGTGTNTDNHASKGLNITVKRGAKVRFYNNDAETHITHGDGNFPHESTSAGGDPNATYEVTTIGIAPGGSGSLGCHSHGSATYGRFRVE